MKVYVVSEQCYDDHKTIAVCSREADADEIAKYTGSEVEELDLDAFKLNVKTRYIVYINTAGEDVSKLTRCEGASLELTLHFSPEEAVEHAQFILVPTDAFCDPSGFPPPVYEGISFVSREEAKRLALELRQKHLVENHEDIYK